MPLNHACIAAKSIATITHSARQIIAVAIELIRKEKNMKIKWNATPDHNRVYDAESAYREDCRRFPKYLTGQYRKSWGQLTAAEQQSWINNPVPNFKEVES